MELSFIFLSYDNSANSIIVIVNKGFHAVFNASAEIFI
jgi:hypothetical protein